MMPKGRGKGKDHPLDTPISLPPWLTKQDMDYYVSKFDKNGFTGPINYYRNLDRYIFLYLTFLIAYFQPSNTPFLDSLTLVEEETISINNDMAAVAGTGNSMLHLQGLK